MDWRIKLLGDVIGENSVPYYMLGFSINLILNANLKMDAIFSDHNEITLTIQKAAQYIDQYFL